MRLQLDIATSNAFRGFVIPVEDHSRVKGAEESAILVGAGVFRIKTV